MDKQEFLAWAYLLTNTTRGVLADYIVATALGIRDTKRVEWDQYDLEIDGAKVEVKSAAYVQTWKQTHTCLRARAFGKSCQTCFVEMAVQKEADTWPLNRR